MSLAVVKRGCTHLKFPWERLLDRRIALSPLPLCNWIASAIQNLCQFKCELKAKKKKKYFPIYSWMKTHLWATFSHSIFGYTWAYFLSFILTLSTFSMQHIRRLLFPMVAFIIGCGTRRESMNLQLPARYIFVLPSYNKHIFILE